jgi:hypothetical protein
VFPGFEVSGFFRIIEVGIINDEVAPRNTRGQDFLNWPPGTMHYKEKMQRLDMEYDLDKMEIDMELNRINKKKTKGNLRPG